MNKLVALILLIFSIETTYMVYLPMIPNSWKIVGAQVWYQGTTTYLIPGMTVYVPHYLNGSDDRHLDILPYVKDYPIVLGFRHAPAEWLSCEKECCPPRPERYQDYADLVATKTQEYLEAGYNIIAFSIENEPEPSPEEISDSMAHFVNCYGPDYAGGATLGDLTSVVYQTSRAALGPDILVLAGEMHGGIHYPGHTDWLDGLLEHGQFDVLSFHYYPRWDIPNQAAIDRGNWLHEYSGEEVWMTETSILGDGGEAHQQRKAEYMQLLLDEWDHPFMWFTLANNGWLATDLCMTRDGGCGPAWYVLNSYLQEK